MAVRTRMIGWFAACFLMGAVVGLVREIRDVQIEVDALGRVLSRELARIPAGEKARKARIHELLARYRSRMQLEKVSLFDTGGHKLGEVPNTASPGAPRISHGVLLSARTGVWDAAAGREVSHLVVWKDMGGRAARSALLGLLAGLAAALGFWALIGSRRRGPRVSAPS